MSDFNFNAPQIIDFSAEDDPTVDKYFDMTDSPGLSEWTATKKTPMKWLFQETSDLENSDPYISQDNVQTVVRPKATSPILRKVLNEINKTHGKQTFKQQNGIVDNGCIAEQLEKMQIGDAAKVSIKPKGNNIQMFDGIEIPVSTKKKHRMATRLDELAKTPVINLRSRSVIRKLDESMSPLSEIDTTVCSVQTETNIPSHPRKFIALAEQVEHFYKDTPDRFRSKPKNAFPVQSKPHVYYQPKTPRLSAIFRNRQTNYLPPEERERQVIEEMKKFQIKAQPINKHLLCGPTKTINPKVVEKKPVTAFEPFNLTEFKKKPEPLQKENIFQFKAQPLPRKILHSPQGIPPKKIIPSTTPYTPKIKVPVRLRVDSISTIRSVDVVDKNQTNTPPKKTILQPFSFELRDKIMIQKREEKIKQKIEEEKKLTAFKAKPIPNYSSTGIRKERMVIPTTVVQPFNLTVLPPKKTVVEEKHETPVFKARPALVLKQKPFEPKKLEYTPVKPMDLHLSTEQRVGERRGFEEKLKREEMLRETLLKKAQEEEEKRVQQEIIKQRKQAEFHARPIPSFKPFEVQPADRSKLTQPISPVFRSGKSNMNKNIDNTLI